jgi:hypothetical protein
MINDQEKSTKTHFYQQLLVDNQLQKINYCYFNITNYSNIIKLFH